MDIIMDTGRDIDGVDMDIGDIGMDIGRGIGGYRHGYRQGYRHGYRQGYRWDICGYR